MKARKQLHQQNQTNRRNLAHTIRPIPPEQKQNKTRKTPGQKVRRLHLRHKTRPHLLVLKVGTRAAHLLMLERLQKIISRAGIASRRHAEDMILTRQLRVKGVVVTELGVKADPDRDRIEPAGKLATI